MNQTLKRDAWCSGLKPSLRVTYLGEPELAFGFQQKHTDPKKGMASFGPSSVSDNTRHRGRIRLGLVGSGDTIAQAREWLTRCADEIEPVSRRRRPVEAFPGFSLDGPFKSEFVVDSACERTVSEFDLKDVCEIVDRRQAFERGLQLLLGEIQIVAEDHQPDVIVVALPQDLYDACRAVGGPKDRSNAPQVTPAERKLQKMARRQKRSQQPLLFDKYEVDADAQLAYRSFRRALKARVMRWRVPIQIMTPRSFFDESSFTSLDEKLAALRRQKIQEPATRAWNFCSAMYFKANGIPWRLADVSPGTCFVGVAFYRQDSTVSPHMRSTLAQLFTDRGDALVIRGEPFEWNIETQGTPHIGRDHAARLVRKVVETYESHLHRPPERLVFHKSSRFTDEEQRGFVDGLRDAGIHLWDLVAFYHREVRAFRFGAYPPVRGSLIEFPEGGRLLYTMGYIPLLDTYPRGHVPRPLEIIEKYGDSDLATVCREILGLSKLNWNCADHAGAYPITLRFARLVGHILAEFSDKDEEPHRHYRFYV